jgi:hypothetical protein
MIVNHWTVNLTNEHQVSILKVKQRVNFSESVYEQL